MGAGWRTDTLRFGMMIREIKCIPEGPQDWTLSFSYATPHHILEFLAILYQIWYVGTVTIF
jgi:hypothetical protein